jgi:hypothetical protein
MGEIKIHVKVWFRHLKERDHLEDLLIGGKVILRWTSRELVVKVCTAFTWFMTKCSGGLL